MTNYKLNEEELRISLYSTLDNIKEKLENGKKEEVYKLLTEAEKKYQDLEDEGTINDDDTLATLLSLEEIKEGLEGKLKMELIN